MEPDEESLRKLRALGYVGTFADPPEDPSKLPDPKAMLGVRLQELHAEMEIAQGRPEQGVQLLGSVLDRDPNNRQALKVLGEQASRGKASRAAVEALRHRMEKPLPPPFDATLPEAMGDACVRMKEFARAVEYYSSALSVVETNAEVHVKLGGVLRQLGRAGDATARFRRALELARNMTEARKELGSLLLEQGRPGDAVAYYNLGIAAAKEGNIAETVGLYEKAIAGEPPHSAAVEELASYYIRDKRFADALRVLRIGSAATPDNLKIINTLAGLLAACHDDALRNGQEALTLAKHAAELTQHRQPAVLATLAAAYAETGEFVKAVETVEQALLLMNAAEQAGLQSTLRQQLTDFRERRPYRDPRF